LLSRIRQRCWNGRISARGGAMGFRSMRTGLAALALLVCAGCAGVPVPTANERIDAPAQEAVAPIPPEPAEIPDSAGLAATHALAALGASYRFGGSTPSTGFDCSGLVQWSFGQAGVRVPRNTDAQRKASRPVHPGELRPGDLLFFDEQGKKNSHVGIYLGGQAFVHAPSSGKRVRRDALGSPYWSRQLSEIRRF
jgi:murein DD-endopeptidase